MFPHNCDDEVTMVVVIDGKVVVFGGWALGIRLEIHICIEPIEQH